ncbi:MAG: hypothetical protein VB934_07175 [Polyangiaceae bacterium]
MKRMTAVGLATAVMAAATLGMASAPTTQVTPPFQASVEQPAETASLEVSPHDQSVELSKKCKCSGGCSMQKWMKKVMQKAVGSGDAKKVAKALRKIASKPVAGYGKWKALAEAGAKAAESGDLKAAKKSCKACHKAYQKKYRKDKALCCGSW